MRGAFADAAPLVKRPSSVSDSSFRNDSGTTRRRGRPRALNLQTLEVGPLASRPRLARKVKPPTRGCSLEDSGDLKLRANFRERSSWIASLFDPLTNARTRRETMTNAEQNSPDDNRLPIDSSGSGGHLVPRCAAVTGNSRHLRRNRYNCNTPRASICANIGAL